MFARPSEISIPLSSCQAELRKNHPGGKEEVKRYLEMEDQTTIMDGVFSTHARSTDIRYMSPKTNFNKTILHILKIRIQLFLEI